MHWFAPDERGLALGIRQAAIPLGGFAGAVALPAIVSARGVHAAFAALAVNSIVWAVLAGIVLRERHVDEEIAGELVSPLRDLRMWILCSASGLVLAGQLAIMALRRPVPPRRARPVDPACGPRARGRSGRRGDRARGRRAPLGPRRSPHPAVHPAQRRACGRRRRGGPLDQSPLVVLVPVLVVAGILGMSWNGLSFAAAAEAAGPASERRGDRLPADRARRRRDRDPDRVRRDRRGRLVASRVPRDRPRARSREPCC